MRTVTMLAVLFSSVVAHAAGESYMSLVGQLYGGLETPRLALQICKEQKPQSYASLERDYKSWRLRNAKFLQDAQLQFDHANARLKVEGHSLSEMDAMATQQLKNLDSEALCSGFAKLLASKDRQINAELGQLLAVVTEADAVLSKREERK